MKLESIKSSKYKKIMENFISLFTLQGLNYILPLITIPYLTRILGAENYGKTLFATSVVIYFQVVADYGFNMSATRNISINRDNKDKIELIFSSVLSIKIIFTIIGSGILVLLIFIIPRLRVEWLLYIFTYIGVVGNSLFPIWLFQGMEEMKYITYLNITIKIISTLAIFIFIRNSENYILLPLINSLVLVIIAIISLVFIKKKMDIRIIKPKIDTIIKELKDGWHLFITTFFSNIMANSGNFIVGIFLGDTMVGYYGAIDKVAKAIISMFTPITTAIFPFTSRALKEDKKSGIKEILKFGKIVMLLSLIVSIGVFIFSKSIVGILCGQEFVEYFRILNIQSIWLVIAMLNNFIGIQFLIGISKGNYYSKSFIIAGMSMIVFDLIFIKQLGIYTIPMGMVVSEAMLSIIMIYFINKNKLYI